MMPITLITAPAPAVHCSPIVIGVMLIGHFVPELRHRASWMIKNTASALSVRSIPITDLWELISV